MPPLPCPLAATGRCSMLETGLGRVHRILAAPPPAPSWYPAAGTWGMRHCHLFGTAWERFARVPAALPALALALCAWPALLCTAPCYARWLAAPAGLHRSPLRPSPACPCRRRAGAPDGAVCQRALRCVRFRQPGGAHGHRRTRRCACCGWLFGVPRPCPTCLTGCCARDCCGGSWRKLPARATHSAPLLPPPPAGRAAAHARDGGRLGRAHRPRRRRAVAAAAGAHW